jgi:hypothetical protein
VIQRITVRQEGAQVLLLSGGVLLGALPWQAADDLARALRAKARVAETSSKAAQVAQDDAVLLRAGFPMGLSSNAKIRAESEKLAAWDRKLRNYMPGGIKSTVHFGAPSIIQYQRPS